MAARWHVDLHLANVASLTHLGLGSIYSHYNNRSDYCVSYFVALGENIYVLRALADTGKKTSLISRSSYKAS